jgi:nitroreductase
LRATALEIAPASNVCYTADQLAGQRSVPRHFIGWIHRRKVVDSIGNQTNLCPATLAEAIQRRTSIRSYTGAPLAEEHLSVLKDMAQTAPRLTNTPVRFVFVEDEGRIDRILVGLLGRYGKIKNPPALVAGIAGPGSYVEESLGFTMQHLILEATRHSIGTCWVSGMFKRKDAAEAAHLAPGEQVLAVSPLGYAAGSGGGELLKSLVGSKKRKSLEDIVYVDRWLGKSPTYLAVDVQLKRIAEAMRWAPSAVNRQPWRLILTETAAVLASVSRDSGLDNGIAMAHWTIAAHEEGLDGRWELELDRNEWRRRLQFPNHATLVGVYPLS